ncbi:hypothetical protein [Hyphomonas sp.]|uniref:hypothetical protein n=1 Tax=Hyphomonas sp. TaxID=87 RepID=UPI00391D906A
MFTQKPAPVPPPSAETFENGITHPELWLWDSWTAELGGTIHLYCLALSRTGHDGAPISPDHRNDYPFHIRHFISVDSGRSWKDEGVFAGPRDTGDGAFARNVWSGGMLARSAGDWVCGFTGIRSAAAGKPFLQTICLARSGSATSLHELPAAALSCPARDYDAIRAAGYYLPARETLGAHDGEEGGPILAWRDPFILDSGDGRLEVFWSAKIGPARPAVAHATVRQSGSAFRIETLHPPMTLPDDSAFTQAEVPKVYADPETGTWYMIISACDRLSETQPADEVTKVLRLYTSKSLRGPWKPAFANQASLIPDTEHLFGASIMQTDFRAGRLSLVAPYTEYAAVDRQLTFAPVKTIRLPQDTTELAASSPKRSGG